MCRGSQVPDVLYGMISVIQNIALDDESRPALASEGTSQVLAHLLNNAKDDPTMQAALWGALVNFAQHKAAAEELHSAGVVTAFCNVFSTVQPDCKPATKLASEFVRCLSRDERCRSKMIDDGVVPVIVSIIEAECDVAEPRDQSSDGKSSEDAKGNGTDTDSGATTTVSNATAVLANLALDETNSARLLEQDSVLCVLCRVCEHAQGSSAGDTGSEKNLQVVAMTVRNFAKHPGNRQSLLASPIVGLLCELCDGSEHIPLLQTTSGVLNYLSWESAGRAMLVKAGAIKSLVLLCSKLQDPRLLLNVAAALANVSLEPQHHDSIVEEGGISILMFLASSCPDTQAQEFAVQALAALAGSDVSRARILEDGALAVLTRVCGNCQSSTPVMLNNVSATLSNLARNAQSGLQMVRGGVVEALVELLASTSNAKALINATCAMAHLASHSECRVPLISKQVIPQLIRHANSCAHTAVLVSIAQTLACLATCSEAVPELVQRQHLVATIQLLHKTPDRRAALHVARLLALLSATDRARAEMVASGCATCLLHLIRAGTARPNPAVEAPDKSTAAADAEPRTAARTEAIDAAAEAALAVQRLAKNKQCLAPLCKAAAVPQLLLAIDFARAPTAAGLLQHAVGALARLASHGGGWVGDAGLAADALCPVLNIMAALEPGGARSSGGAIGACSGDALMRSATELLANLATHEGGRAHIKAVKATQALIATCNASEDDQTLTNGAAALANLALDDKLSTHIVACGGAEAVLRMLEREPVSGRVLQFATGAARNLSRPPANKSKLLLVLQQQLLHLCGTGIAEHMIATNLAGTLANLSLHEENQRPMAQAGTAEFLVALCRRLETKGADAAQNARTLEFAVRCMATLSCEAANRADVAGDTVPGFLREMCDRAGASEILLGNASVVLMNLARQPECRAPLLQGGALDALAKLLSGPPHDQVLANAARALANLGLEPGLRPALVDGGVVRPLVGLCSGSRSAAVLANAAWALANLAHDEGCAPQLAQDGVLRALRTVQRAFGAKLPANLRKPLAAAISRLDGLDAKDGVEGEGSAASSSEPAMPPEPAPQAKKRTSFFSW
eukprot:g448.t1